MAFKQILTRVQSGYKYALNQHPYVIQGVQAGLIMGAGDLMAQTVVEKKKLNELNLKRTGQFTMLGMCLVGPTLRFAYGFLDRKITTKHQLKRTVQKVACDQLIFAPVFVVVITSAISAIQGFRGHEIVDRVKNNYVDIMITNYCLWPAAQVINFSLIPLNYQVLYAQVVALIWNTYFSWKMSKDTMDMGGKELESKAV